MHTHQPHGAAPLPPAERQHGCPKTLAPLHVITVCSNPQRFNARFQLLEEFVHHAEAAGAIVYVVELAFGERPFALTDAGNPRHFRYRTHDELWHKENMQTLGLSRLPEGWEYAALVDADVAFTNPHWVNETVQQLQHFSVVQMFTHAIDQGPNYEPFAQHRGFVYGWRLDPSIDPDPGMAYGTERPGAITGSLYHPGYAWAWRKSALDAIGGLYETAVMGSADTYMARGLVGKVEGAMGEAAVGLNPVYNNSIKTWQARASRMLRQNVGYVDTTLIHYWHGKKKDRRYFDRNKVMIESKFDPHIDLVKDTRGVIRFGSNNIKLRDGLREYFRRRNEDSIDM